MLFDLKTCMSRGGRHRVFAGVFNASSTRLSACGVVSKQSRVSRRPAVCRPVRNRRRLSINWPPFVAQSTKMILLGALASSGYFAENDAISSLFQNLITSHSGNFLGDVLTFMDECEIQYFSGLRTIGDAVNCQNSEPNVLSTRLIDKNIGIR